MKKNAIYKSLKSKLSQRWGKLSESTQLKTITFVNQTINYLINAVLFTVPTIYILSYYHDITAKTGIFVTVCYWVSLPLFEHYYVWIREDWKQNDKD